MFIEQIYNHNHRLHQQHLLARGAYILPAFILTLCSHSIAFNSLIVTIYILLIRYISNISGKHLVRLFSIPLTFISLGCITIAMHVTFPLKVQFIPANTELAILIFTKSFALIAVLFMALMIYTISEIAAVFRLIKVPSLFIELFVLMYRFNMKLLSNTKQLYLAQKCRLGYTSNKQAYRHIGLLFASVFQSAIKANKTTEIAMTARLGNHQYHFVSPHRTFCWKACTYPLFLASLLLMFYLILNF
ncbi:hypothetical protein EMN47_12600 [Prolixibacteraceae bacterium JC049]|nr:hypothetical protein [Prolixibacteraceae bacterium JC049]